jgi:hypothetical protein
MAEPNTVTRLFLVRHGATAATEEDRFWFLCETARADDATIAA